MTHQQLFKEYQSKLAWIERMSTPEALEFYHQTKENWDCAKWAIFSMYQELRHLVDNGVPTQEECIKFDEHYANIYSPITFHDGELAEDNSGEYVCKVIGELNYRERKYPIYCDDYAMSIFVLIDGHEIELESFCSENDWYYEIDKLIDKINI